MIRPLRRRHAVLAAAFLAVAAPVGLVAAVWARPDVSVMAELPIAVDRADAPAPAGARTLPPGTIGDAAGAGVEVALATWSDGDARFVRLTPQDDPELPDVLVYWTPAPPDDASGPPPDDAVLLGTLSGALPRTLALPAGARGGSLHLYSLAHRRGVGALALDDAGSAEAR